MEESQMINGGRNKYDKWRNFYSVYKLSNSFYLFFRPMKSIHTQITLDLRLFHMTNEGKPWQKTVKSSLLVACCLAISVAGVFIDMPIAPLACLQTGKVFFILKLSSKGIFWHEYCLAQWSLLPKELSVSFWSSRVASKTVKDYTSKLIPKITPQSMKNYRNYSWNYTGN